jgi:hypothetical protein
LRMVEGGCLFATCILGARASPPACEDCSVKGSARYWRAASPPACGDCGLIRLSVYSSAHKGWSCWTGLNTPSKADAVPHLSACTRSDHAEARRRGDRERRAHKVCWTGLHTSPEAGASRATAGPDYSRQNSSTSALIRRIRADLCSIPAFGAKPACAGWRVPSR